MSHWYKRLACPTALEVADISLEASNSIAPPHLNDGTSVINGEEYLSPFRLDHVQNILFHQRVWTTIILTAHEELVIGDSVAFQPSICQFPKQFRTTGNNVHIEVPSTL